MYNNDPYLFGVLVNFGLGKKTFRGIVKFVDCRLQKLKKGFEILKFVDFHFKFVDFACRDSTVKCSI
jgi:hypothetical protein